MSETVIFIIGAIVFAITVYGTVMAGGALLTRIEIEENEDVREHPDGVDVDKEFPLGEY